MGREGNGDGDGDGDGVVNTNICIKKCILLSPHRHTSKIKTIC